MQAPRVLACNEARFEAILKPDDMVIELLVSDFVQPNHRVVRPVQEYLEGVCYDIVELHKTDNPLLLWGSGTHAKLKVLADCPETPHSCKGDRGLLIEELEKRYER